MKTYFVFLRRPGELDDKRNDPFWEFGSFGKTGCHSKNLLHPRRTPLRDGDRLAFIQGGDNEIRVIGLTPSIQVKGNVSRLELMWDKIYRPLPYSQAPILINNDGRTDFPSILPILHGTQRSTFCGAAGSRLRSKTTPIEHGLAAEIHHWFSKNGLPTIEHYIEAIEGPTGRWRKHAAANRWASLENRTTAYESLDVTIGKVPEIVSAKGISIFKPKRRC